MSASLASAVSLPYTTAPKLRSSVEELAATLLSTHISATWLDIYPPTETTVESASPALPASPVTDSKRLTRINTIKDILAKDIKSNIEIRELFLGLKDYGREICLFCSATNDPSMNCGSACARLRRQISSRVESFIDSPWRANAVQSVKNYHRVLEEIEKRGNLARSSQILKWEKAVKGLKEDTMNQSEMKDENGWSNQVKYDKAKKAGVDIEWTFGSAWGTTLPPDEEVAPHEDVR